LGINATQKLNIETIKDDLFIISIGITTDSQNMQIKPQWQQLIATEQQKLYFQNLQEVIQSQREQGLNIYPPEFDVFSAFSSIDLSDVNVVILGQDPYHGAGQAHGLSFSVLPGIKVPPSLKNIYKELVTDIEGFVTPEHGHLISWAEQGVLLLNTVLTVEEAKAHSHAKLGWETFTDEVISTISEQNDGCVFILWGAHAKKKGRDIDSDKHCILAGAHPSPLSAYRGFYGSKPFSKANEWLSEQGKKTIDWCLK
jgi:uracil-DNA glycosylase